MVVAMHVYEAEMFADDREPWDYEGDACDSDRDHGGQYGSTVGQVRSFIRGSHTITNGNPGITNGNPGITNGNPGITNGNPGITNGALGPGSGRQLHSFGAFWV